MKAALRIVLRPRPLALCLLVAQGAAWAQQTPHLPEVAITGPRDAAIGVADSASEGAAEKASFQSRPKLRPGDIVEAVPGVGEHSAAILKELGFASDHIASLLANGVVRQSG